MKRYHMFIKIIISLSLHTGSFRHSSSFLFSENNGMMVLRSDDNRHNYARSFYPFLSTTTRHRDTTPTGSCSAMIEEELQDDISMQRDNFPLIMDEANNCETVDWKNDSTRGVCGGGAWMERLRQLREFKKINGHTMVPKRYKNNPSLGNWVCKQRQMYHNLQTGTKPCSLTQERINLLNELNFCWNAKPSIRRNGNLTEQDTVIDIEWWSHYEELRKHCRNHDDIHTIHRQSRQLGVWLDRQRKLYYVQRESEDINTQSETAINFDNTRGLSSEKISALSRISDVWWMTRRQWQWEMRYRELQQFASKHGHCCVPISYSGNTHLAHWVSNQRKLYNLLNAGKRSELTISRIQKLESIGFVWNRWDYEFSKKQSYQVRNESS